MRKIRAHALIYTGAALLMSSEAAAQSSKTTVDDSEVQEVVVTAQRREERLMDVPIAITALSGEQLKESGVVSTRDLTTVTPGLSALSQGFAFQPTIRGIGTTSTSAGDETNVALYIDNVYIPYMLGNAFNMKGVERIEVLKGPQGTLFGRNATGGAIRIVTRKPGDTFKAEISSDYGFELQSREVSAYVAGPIKPNIAASAEVYYYKDDGYIKNIVPNLTDDVGDTRQLTLRGKVVWDANAWANLTLAMDYTEHESSIPFATSALPNPAGQVLAFKNVRGVVLVPDPTEDPYYVSLSFHPSHRSISTGGSLTGEFAVPKHKLTSITSFRTFKSGSDIDSDRTNLELTRGRIYQTGEVLTQEIDLASQFDGPLNYVAGAFYYWANNGAPYNNSLAAPLSAVDASGLRNVLGPLRLISNNTAKVGTRSYAIFGEATWDVTSALSAVLGYRYTSETKRANVRSLLTGASTRGEDTWRNSSVRATAKYKLSDDVNVYGTFSTGFKSGAFNPTAIVTPMQVVRPEKVKAVELGLKAALGRASIRASVFDYSYDDIQLQVNNILNPAAGTTILQNAASAKIQGADLEANFRVSSAFSTQLGISWIPTAEYRTFIGGITFVPNAGGVGARTVPTDLSGTRMIRTPELTVNVGGNYGFDLAGGKTSVSVNYFRSSKFLWVPGGAAIQPAYDTLNARVSWSDPSERFTFYGWGRNLTDEVYYASTAASTAGFVGSFAAPREFGVGVEVAF